jgi:hypothetical protein
VRDFLSGALKLLTQKIEKAKGEPATPTEPPKPDPEAF